MSAVSADAAERLDVVATTPAHGWWALYRYPNDKTCRDRVAVWATVRKPDGSTDVVALVAGDGYALALPGGRFSRLWCDGESYCHCGRGRALPAGQVDDVWWCPECVGVIREDEGWAP